MKHPTFEDIEKGEVIDRGKWEQIVAPCKGQEGSGSSGEEKTRLSRKQIIWFSEMWHGKPQMSDWDSDDTVSQ